MKEKIINLNVSYPVPKRIQAISVDEIIETEFEYYELFKKGQLIMVMNKENYLTKLVKTGENEFCEFYNIYIN